MDTTQPGGPKRRREVLFKNSTTVLNTTELKPFLFPSFFCFAVAIVRFTTSREFRTVLTAGHLKQTIVGFSNLSLSQVLINFSFSFMTYHQFQSCATQLRTCNYWLSSL